jgi:hypothetical protein
VYGTLLTHVPLYKCPIRVVTLKSTVDAMWYESVAAFSNLLQIKNSIKN